MFINYKKGVSPIVALALLLVVAVVGAISFQSWFNTYSQTVFAEVETKDSTDAIDIQSVFGNYMYIYTSGSKYLTDIAIYNSSGNEICNVSTLGEGGIQGNTVLLANFDNATVSGATVRDLTGNNNDGTITNAVHTNANCISGGCMYFDGSGDYVDFGNIAEFENESLTLSLWFYTEDLSSQRTLISNARDSPPGPVNGFHLDFRQASSTDFRIKIWNVSGEDTQNTSKISLQAWHHVVVTYNDSELLLYIDGILHSNTTEPNNLAFPATYNTYLGRQGVLATWWYYGYLDELAIYDEAVNAAEVRLLYNSQKALFREHLLNQGTREVSLEHCNLVEGETYDALLVGPDGIVSEEFYYS